MRCAVGSALVERRTSNSAPQFRSLHPPSILRQPPPSMSQFSRLSGFSGGEKIHICKAFNQNFFVKFFNLDTSYDATQTEKLIVRRGKCLNVAGNYALESKFCQECTRVFIFCLSLIEKKLRVRGNDF